MDFTLVTTVLNEIINLDKSIRDIESQTLKPDEIIITDGGSTDGTLAKLQRWSIDSDMNIKILTCPGCNVARGRNIAIENASNELIVSTDFGCRFHPEWLENIVTPFTGSGVKIVGGNYTVNESDIHTFPARANYILTNGYKIDLKKNFIPSSRAIAFYRNVWKDIGGYPEQLTLAGDDTWFAQEIVKRGYNIYVVEKPFVFWERHKTIKGYAKEAYRYGLGDGEARQNLRNFISNAIETLLRYLFFTTLFTIMVAAIKGVYIPEYLLYILILSIPGLRSYFRSVNYWMRLRSRKYNFKVVLYSFLLIETTRFYYIKGYIKGRLYEVRTY